MFCNLGRGAAIAVMGAMLSVQTASAETIRIAYETPDTHLKARTVALFAEELDAATEGELSVETFPGASLIPSNQEVTAAIRGQVEAIVPFISYYEAITPKAKLLTTPLVFRSYEHLTTAMEGEVGASIYADLEEKGLKPLGFWYDTPTVIFTSEKPVESLGDLEGLKIRTYPSATLEKMLSTLNANPTVIPGSEVYLALQNGVVDGAVTTPSFAVSLKLDEVLKYITDVKLVYGGFVFAMNKAFYDGLSDEMRAAVDASAAAATEWNKSNIQSEIDKSLEQAAANGVSVIPVSEEEVARWSEAMRPLHEEAEPAVKELIDLAQTIE